MKNITNENELNESSTKSTACYVAGIPVGIKTEDQKLSLGINEEVINIAKNAGIKISETTHQILKSTMYDQGDNTLEGAEKAYDALFDAISPLLERYPTRVDVGFNTFKQARVVITPMGDGVVCLDRCGIGDHPEEGPANLRED